MKKKVITALLITMTLTLGGVGTAYAMNNDMAVLSGEVVNNVNMIKEGFIWVVDKEAVYETVHHEAEYKTVHHEAEYKTVHHEAEYKTVHHEAEGYYEKQQVQVGEKDILEKQLHGFCYTCDEKGFDFGLYLDPVVGGLSNDFAEHLEGHHKNGVWNPTIGSKYVDVVVGKEPIYEEQDVWIETKPAWDEQVLVKEAYDEQVLVKEAYDEQILVKEAWDETILVSPEEGHWEPVKDEEKPEKPEQKPDEGKPETPEQKPDEGKPETPEQKPDEEKPETPEQKPEQKPSEQKPGKPDNSNTDNKQDSTEDTSKDKTGNKEDNKTDDKKEDTAPKTGDPTNLAYLATLAGSALVGGVSWKFRKRK